jgi:riboflavin kinase/FMN adenylyltransferase
MLEYDGIDGLRRLPPGTVVSVGNYDGVHRGHRRLLEAARSLSGAAGVAVVTFEPHPLTVLRPDRAPPRLTPLPLKREALGRCGVDHLAVLSPSPDVLGMSAEAFWALLRDEVRPTHVIEGPEFIFGKGRGGTMDKLRAWAAGTAVRIHTVAPVTVPLLDLYLPSVSSTLVRWLLLNGRVRDAAIALGHPYAVRGTVVKGFQRGRTIGVPTANLDCGEQLVPAEGVYVGRSTVDGARYPAAVSIGRLPTFGDDRLQFEAHLVGFNGDLYGRTIDVELLDWVREQWKFPSLDALKQRLAADIAHVVDRSDLDASQPIVSLQNAEAFSHR